MHKSVTFKQWVNINNTERIQLCKVVNNKWIENHIHKQYKEKRGQCRSNKKVVIELKAKGTHKIT